MSRESKGLMNIYIHSHVYKLNIIQKKLAFTLAEVLIVLGIIGIIAEMTIPTLMNNVNDLQYKVGWKKAFSAFSQATLQMANDNGGSLAGYFTSDSDIRDKYAQYLLKSKSCDNSQSEGCWPANTQDMKGTQNALSPGPSLILNDGSIVQFWLGSASCTQAVGTPIVFYRCAGAALDVNGLKKPNTFGKDTFVFHILDNRILPYGTKGDYADSLGSDCSSTGTGQACSALFLYQ